MPDLMAALEAEPGRRAEDGRRQAAHPQARRQRRRRAGQEAGPARNARQGRQEALDSPGVASKAVEVEVEGRRLKLSNLDKVLYPAVGFTKGQVIDYYTRIAPVLLPHLRDRPLTLKRYPNGVDGKFFYEKQCPVAPAGLGERRRRS